MVRLFSPYVKVACPDGPRYILKNPEKAFSIIAPSWNARVKTLLKFYMSAQTDVELDIGKSAKTIVEKLTEKYAALQAHYQAAYINYVANPCSKESQKTCEEAMAKIREKEYALRELEIGTKNAEKAIAKARALKKHNKKPDKTLRYKFNDQPFKEARYQMHEIEELVSKF